MLTRWVGGRFKDSAYISKKLENYDRKEDDPRRFLNLSLEKLWVPMNHGTHGMRVT